MSVANFEERVLKIVGAAVPPAYRKAKVTRESNLARDLGIDSLALMHLVFKFEEEFGVEIDADEVDAGSLRTVNDLLKLGKEIVDKAGGR